MREARRVQPGSRPLRLPAVHGWRGLLALAVLRVRGVYWPQGGQRSAVRHRPHGHERAGELRVPDGVRGAGADGRARVLHHRQGQHERDELGQDAAGAAGAGRQRAILGVEPQGHGGQVDREVQGPWRLGAGQAAAGRRGGRREALLPLLHGLRWAQLRALHPRPGDQELPERLQQARHVRAQLVPLRAWLLRRRLLARRGGARPVRRAAAAPHRSADRGQGRATHLCL